MFSRIRSHYAGKKIIIIIAAIFIIAVFAVNLTGLWPFLNRPINYLVAGTPDKSCQTDVDCKIKSTHCGYCGDCGDAVNINWQQYCPFKTYFFVVNCESCPPWRAKCVQGRCQKYFEQQVFDFESCAAAGNPIMESYPRQCRANGQTFVEVINDNLNFNINGTDESACKNLCGDGVCAQIVCLAIGCPCAETVESCPQDCQKAQTGGTGIISGQVTTCPTCPVIQNPPDPTCADKPYQTTIQIIDRNSPAGAPYKVIASDAQGNYNVTLPAGEYNFQPAGGSMLPRCNAQDITVTANSNQTVNFSCDTGIR